MTPNKHKNIFQSIELKLPSSYKKFDVYKKKKKKYGQNLIYYKFL